MSREDRKVVRALAVMVVASLSLLSGCAAFQFVTKEQAAVQDGKVASAPGTPNSSGTRATGGTSPGVKAPRNALPGQGQGQVRRVPAYGQQLWAAQPLSDIHQDQGSTILLPDGRTLWIFADTFQLYNDPKFFITSAAGLSNPGSWQLQYSLGDTINGARVPAEFMPRTPSEQADRRNGEFYQAVWPTGSTRLPNGRIIISYAKYRVLLKTKQFTFMGAGLFEYTYRGFKKFRAGDQARRIADNLWNVYDGEVRSPIYADGFVYFTQCQNLRCYSLRTTPQSLTDKQSYRWWTGSGWSSNPASRDPMIVRTNHPGGNPSIVRLKNGLFAMADTEAGSVSQTGQLWVAAQPWGPWSRAAPFIFPRCPPPGCYGLNLHPDASTGAALRVSYATNGVGPFVRVDDVPIELDPGGAWIRVSGA
jgi:hypothetical protein